MTTFCDKIHDKCDKIHFPAILLQSLFVIQGQKNCQHSKHKQIIQNNEYSQQHESTRTMLFLKFIELQTTIDTKVP